MELWKFICQVLASEIYFSYKQTAWIKFLSRNCRQLKNLPHEVKINIHNWENSSVTHKTLLLVLTQIDHLKKSSVYCLLKND